MHPASELLGTGGSECQQPVAGGLGNSTFAAALWLPQARALSCPLPASWPWLLVVPGAPAVSSLPALSGRRLGSGGRGAEERKRLTDQSRFTCGYLCLLLVAVFHPWSAHMLALLSVFLKNWVWNLFIEFTVVSLVCFLLLSFLTSGSVHEIHAQ